MPTPQTPDDFDHAYQHACQLFQAGKLQEAIDAFARAAQLRPEDFRPHEMTACCLGNLGRWQESLAAFDRAGQLGHDCPSCWYNRSIALCNLRRAPDALRALERSLELNPDNLAAWYDRGLILGMGYGRAQGEMEPFDGRHEQAVAAFDRVLAANPDHYGAWYCKAYVLYKISHSWQATQRLVGASGSSAMTHWRVSIAVAARKGGRPVRHSYRTAPGRSAAAARRRRRAARPQARSRFLRALGVARRGPAWWPARRRTRPARAGRWRA
jgi:tetratricopeptide (TPR) repeat protein